MQRLLLNLCVLALALACLLVDSVEGHEPWPKYGNPLPKTARVLLDDSPENVGLANESSGMDCSGGLQVGGNPCDRRVTEDICDFALSSSGMNFR